MWPGCGLLTDVPTSGVGQRLLHFPIHRKNAISSLSAADSLLALFSLERFNSLLSYPRHQLWDSMTPFSVCVHSLLLWQNGKSKLNSSDMDTKTPSYFRDTAESGCEKTRIRFYRADYLWGLRFLETHALLVKIKLFSIHFNSPYRDIHLFFQLNLWM